MFYPKFRAKFTQVLHLGKYFNFTQKYHVFLWHDNFMHACFPWKCMTDFFSNSRVQPLWVHGIYYWLEGDIFVGLKNVCTLKGHFTGKFHQRQGDLMESHSRPTKKRDFYEVYGNSYKIYKTSVGKSESTFIIWSLLYLVHESDHFLVPKGGTNSSHVFCKDHTLECSKSLTGPLYNIATMYDDPVNGNEYSGT